MPRVLSVSSSRADVGLLKPVWRALASRKTVELHILATGMYAGEEFQDVPASIAATLHRAGEDMGGQTGFAAARSMAASAVAAAEIFDRFEFDCILVTGDRLDMIPAAFAALPYNIPLAHLHGGELTYGAIDDRVRHAMTKMSHLHFVSGVDAAERLARMGEEPWRIRITGAPGLEALAAAPSLSAAEFAGKLNLPFDSEFLIVTVHPETNSADPEAPMRAVLAALEEAGTRALITAPNADPHGLKLRALLDRWLPGRPQVAFRDTLGTELYANALRHAVAMVGNSSSGLIEAGVFGLPVINVGTRQQGRAAGDNVQHVANDANAIVRALRELLKSRKRFAAGSPYGDGHAGERIAAVLAELPERRRLLEKVFYDGGTPLFKAPWDGSKESDRKRSVG